MTQSLNIQKLSSFSDGTQGGNPAGVVIADSLPSTEQMQQIAAEVGFSETAFAEPADSGYRVRYFSPQSEVPFCGHATIALGAALAQSFGNRTYPLHLNNATISVDGRITDQGMSATLQSPPTHSHAASEEMLDSALALFGLQPTDLDSRIPSAFAHAGANHLVLFLKSRERLAQMHYDLVKGKRWMDQHELVTVLLGYIESDQLFHTRNAFASGGVLEDPATGAATAALAGYLRDINWPHGGDINIVQGEDMGSKSLINAQFSDTAGESIAVSGSVRSLEG